MTTAANNLKKTLLCAAMAAAGLLSPAAATGQVTVSLRGDSVVSSGYLGNGVQWDPYQLDYGHGRMELSEADIAKTYARLDFMKPGLVRMMINASSLADAQGKESFDGSYRGLKPLLDYCQTRRVNVVFGDWGGSLLNSRTKEIDKTNVRRVARFVKYLVDEKGYDCIRWFNFINEPNGDWSAADGDFDLWADGMRETYTQMKRAGVADKVKLMAPDVAIWEADNVWWVERTAAELGDIVNLYDIHTYPSKYTVNTNRYRDIIRAYRDRVPEGHKIIMGEIGLKYVAPEDNMLRELNELRAGAAPYASTADSQMSVFDFSYGLDMADVMIQTMQAGYSGTVAWMLDDSMHGNEAPDKLKTWGFWNIFGEEFFGAELEKVRPWFYAWSMLCAAVPQGSEVLATESDSPGELKCTLARLDGKQSLILLNISGRDLDVALQGLPTVATPGMKVFEYSRKSMFGLESELSMPGVKALDGDSLPAKLNVPAKSLVIISNIM